MANKAPGFDLPVLDLPVVSEGRRTLNDLVSGGPLVLVFFKVSCPTCQFALPFADRIARAGGRLIAISQDDSKATLQFKKQFGLQMEILLDEKGYPASNAYGIEVVPTFFHIGADRTIAHSFHGFVRDELDALARSFDVQVFRAGEAVPALKAG